MKNQIKRFLLDEEGISLAEYGVILGVIFTVGAAVLSTLSDRIVAIITKASTAIPS